MKKRGLALLIVSTMIAAMLFVLPASAATDTIPFHADFEEGLPTCVKAGDKTSLDTNITAAVVGGRNCMKVSALTSGDNNAYVKITLPTLETGKAYKLSAMFYFDSAEMNGGFAQLYLAGNSVNTNDRPGIKLKDTNMPTDTWFPMEWIVRGRSDANFLYCLVQRKVNSTTDTTVYFDDIQLSAYESDELMLNGDFETVMTKTSDSNYKQPVGWVYGKGSSHEPDAKSGSQWVPDESTSDYGISLVSDTQSYDGNTLFVCSNALRNASYEIPALENGATYKISLMAKSTSTSDDVFYFFTGTRDGNASEALNSNLAVLPKSGYEKIEFFFKVPADAIAKDKVLNFSSRQKGSLLDNISVKKVSDYNFEHTAVTTTDAGKEITISYYSNPSATAATDASVPTVLVCLYNNASNLTLTAIDTVVVTKNIEKKLVEGTTAALYTVSTVYVDMGSKAVQIPAAANTIKLMAWTNTTSIIPLRSATEITIQ